MADDLTRRAIITARQSSDSDTAHDNRLTTREQAIVEAWRADRDEHSEQFGGLAECGGEGVECDIHPVTLVDHEGPVSCVWCALAANRGRAEHAEAAGERVRALVAALREEAPRNAALGLHIRCGVKRATAKRIEAALDEEPANG